MVFPHMKKMFCFGFALNLKTNNFTENMNWSNFSKRRDHFKPNKDTIH